MSAITGIASVTYGVTDLEESARFFDDFGLRRARTSPGAIDFLLDEGSEVRLRDAGDPDLPAVYSPHESQLRLTTWAVPSRAALKAIGNAVAQDGKVSEQADGSIRFTDPAGVTGAIQVHDRKPVLNAPSPVNAANNVQRLNQPRKWRSRALPKTINHVVYVAEDAVAMTRWYRARLGFRLSDISRGVGWFLRAPQASEHHSLFVMQKDGLPGYGEAKHDHVCFGVEDIDELMVGVNHMQRQGWPLKMGPGRNRIASALFAYFAAPCGGEVEYGADTDYYDDSAQPMEYNPLFGYLSWIAGPLPPFAQREIPWDVRPVTDDITDPAP